MPKHTLIFSCFIMIYSGLCAPQILAAPLFGPNEYVRTPGKPNIFSEAFTQCEPEAKYQLKVINGLEDGSKRLSSATIYLNGAEVLSPDDLNQNVGSVIRPIDVQEDNALKIQIASVPGGWISVSVECVQNCFEVSIVPVAEPINIDRTIVRGEINSSSPNFGITINEMPGLIHENTWAYWVALGQGSNLISVLATNGCGQTATATMDVTVNLINEATRITGKPIQGISPLSVLLNVSPVKEDAVYRWDLDGNGTIDSEGAALSEVSTIYDNEGLYYPSVTVVNTLGQSHTNTTLIQVVSRNYIDSNLQAIWTGLKDSLNAGNIEQTLKLFAVESRDRYRAIFGAVDSPLSDIAADMAPIEFISLKNGIAKYRIRREETSRQITYYIYFVIDQDGLWRIKQF